MDWVISFFVIFVVDEGIQIDDVCKTKSIVKVFALGINRTWSLRMYAKAQLFFLVKESCPGQLFSHFLVQNGNFVEEITSRQEREHREKKVLTFEICPVF
jgi:hypothetical protein